MMESHDIAHFQQQQQQQSLLASHLHQGPLSLAGFRAPPTNRDIAQSDPFSAGHPLHSLSFKVPPGPPSANQSHLLPRATPSTYYLQRGVTGLQGGVGAVGYSSSAYVDPNIIQAEYQAAMLRYMPHEIKHRKRTTRTQLKLLEATYRTDQKPNATLRKHLAAQLEMTARGVQVWFQNRRAKDKNNAKKAKAAADEEDEDDAEDDDAAGELEDGPVSSPEQALSPASDSTTTPASTTATARTSTAAMRRRGSAPTLAGGLGRSRLVSDSARTSTGMSPPNGPPNDILSLRRGSLPINVLAHQSPPPPTAPSRAPTGDILGRRKSLDPTNLRLGSHPYASAVSGLNAKLSTHGTQRSSSSLFLRTPLPATVDEQRRGNIYHRPSMQYGLRTSALPESQYHHRTISGPLAPPTLGLPYPSSFGGNYPAKPRSGNMGYAFPPRVLAQPIAGPLPAPDFSFGSPAGVGAQEQEEEDLASPFEGYRRFGSLASVADSDTTSPSLSTYSYSRYGSITGSEHNLAADNTSPGQEVFVSKFSGLEVNHPEAGAATAANSNNSTSPMSPAFSLFAARTADHTLKSGFNPSNIRRGAILPTSTSLPVLENLATTSQAFPPFPNNVTYTESLSSPLHLEDPSPPVIYGYGGGGTGGPGVDEVDYMSAASSASSLGLPLQVAAGGTSPYYHEQMPLGETYHQYLQQPQSADQSSPIDQQLSYSDLHQLHASPAYQLDLSLDLNFSPNSLPSVPEPVSSLAGALSTNF